MVDAMQTDLWCPQRHAAREPTPAGRFSVLCACGTRFSVRPEVQAAYRAAAGAGALAPAAMHDAGPEGLDAPGARCTQRADDARPGLAGTTRLCPSLTPVRPMRATNAVSPVRSATMPTRTGTSSTGSPGADRFGRVPPWRALRMASRRRTEVPCRSRGAGGNDNDTKWHTPDTERRDAFGALTGTNERRNAAA